MIYDINVHLPQLMEFLIQDFRVGDVDKLEAGKILVTKIMDNPMIVKDFKNIEQMRQGKTDKLYEDAFKRIKEALETKKQEEVFIVIDEVRNRLSKDLIKLEQDNWETVFSQIIKHIKKIETVEDHAEG